MPQNRIKQLRLKKNLTAQALGEKVGLTQGQISRIETGERGLSLAVAERIAMALGADIAEVLGIVESDESQLLLSEDAEPYKPKPEDFFEIKATRRPNIYPWRIKSNVLDQLGMRTGDVVFVDISTDAIQTVKPMQPVIAQLFDPRAPDKSITIVRQFVPPALLITNSLKTNAMPLNLNRDNVVIKGVILKSLVDLTD